MSVFVLDRSGVPPMPCREKRARKLLAAERARVHRLVPFVIRLMDRHAESCAFLPLRIKLDPGSKTTGLPVELCSGDRTKYNRSQLGVPKTHALNAACVGSTDAIKAWRRPTLQVKCTGRGNHQRTRLDEYGFARDYLTRSKAVRGFKAGDLVRASGSFNIQIGSTVVQGVSHHKHCRIIQRSDGYGYSRIAISKGDAGAGRVTRAALSLPGLKAEVSRATG